MNSNKAKNKKTTTKGERLKWSILSSVQSVKLTREVIVGKVVNKEDLMGRSNSNYLKSNVLIN